MSKRATKWACVQPPLWRARFETPNFTFEVFGWSEECVREVLNQAWVEHARRSGAERDYIKRFADDIEVQSLAVGVPYLDRERFDITQGKESN